MPRVISDLRRQYVIAEAIVFAIEAMSRLPDLHRPQSNIDDLKEVLNDMTPGNLAQLQQMARRRADILVGIMPRD